MRREKNTQGVGNSWCLGLVARNLVCSRNRKKFPCEPGGEFGEIVIKILQFISKCSGKSLKVLGVFCLFVLFLSSLFLG